MTGLPEADGSGLADASIDGDAVAMGLGVGVADGVAAGDGLELAFGGDEGAGGALHAANNVAAMATAAMVRPGRRPWCADRVLARMVFTPL